MKTQPNRGEIVEINRIYNMPCEEGLKLLADESVDLVVTSPPYNKGLYDKHTPHYTDVWKQRNIKYEDFSDNLPRNIYVRQQIDMLKECIRILKPQGSIFYNHKSIINNHKIIFPDYVFQFNIRQIIIWDRGSTPQLSPIRFLPTTEYLFWITKANTQPKFQRIGKYDKEVWPITPKPYGGHPAPFPYELAEQCIISTTDKNDIVCDPYSGSGTTCLVAKEKGRQFIGFENNKNYYKISVDRLNGVEYTGQTSIFTDFELL